MKDVAETPKCVTVSPSKPECRIPLRNSKLHHFPVGAQASRAYQNVSRHHPAPQSSTTGTRRRPPSHGVVMNKIFEMAPNMTDFFLSLVVCLSDSVFGSFRSLASINPVRVTLYVQTVMRRAIIPFVIWYVTASRNGTNMVRNALCSLNQ